MIVLKNEPVVRFEPGKAFPMNAYYTMLGQTYESLKHFNDTLYDNGKDVDSILYAFKVALNGYPKEDKRFINNDKYRVFDIRYLDEGKAQVCFSVAGSSIFVTIINLSLDGAEFGNYRNTYEDEYPLDMLDYYGFVDCDSVFGPDDD